jgi:hypothetical protein
MANKRLFFIIFGVANFSLLLYGLLALTMPGILYESFSQYVYRFPDSDYLAIGYLQALYRLLGFFNLLVGLTGLFLLWRYHRSPQPWIAYLAMALSMLAYLAPIVFDNTVGHIGFFEILEHILFGSMVITGISEFRKLEI